MTHLPSSTGSQAPAAPGAGATVGQWLSWLESIHPAKIDLGLERVLEVFQRLFPHRPTARVITVAGTNGKGSTVAALEALLRASGRHTGAYTSPHLVNYNERIRIDGADVSDTALIAAFEEVEAARGSVTLTYFEFGTLAAFVVLANAGVQDWILEVGLGGRLDAVNVIDSDLAVITSVDVDHVAFLGTNREIIGLEKAGILRPGMPAVVADTDPPRSVLQEAVARQAVLTRAGRDYTIEETSGTSGALSATLYFQGRTIRLPTGPLPLQSVAAAVVAAHILEPATTESDTEAALAGVNAPGRFELLARQPEVYADVGHNPHAARWLCARLQNLKTRGRKVHAVYAALADKDTLGVARAMAPVVDCWYLSGLSVPRGLAPEALATRLAPCKLDQVHNCNSVTEAITAAKGQAGVDDILIVFGSFFTVAEARTLFL